MGLMVNGEWQDQWYDTKASGGEFQREAAQLRNWITADGSPGPSGEGGFEAESGRYHLYVSLACPWAHRTLIFRELKALQPHVSVSVVSPIMLEHGWSFDTGEGSTGDALFDHQFLHQIYQRYKPDYSGRVTVPVLWDKQRQTIVSNESSEIIRMFNSAFDGITDNREDFWPEAARGPIDEVNELVYHKINNGVYKCGFATEQSVYERHYDELFAALDTLDQRLASQRYLIEGALTEADWRLFTTLVRFDSVYHGHFKCNRQRLEDFQHLSGYVRDLYQRDGVAAVTDFDHIKRHYYISHPMINANQLVPKGPAVDYSRPHTRADLA